MANTVPVSTIRTASLNTTNEWADEAEIFLNELKNVGSAGSLVDVLGLPSIQDDGHSFTFASTLFGRIGTEPTVSGSTVFTTPDSNPGALSLNAINTTLDEVTMPGYDITKPTIELPARLELVTPDAPDAPLLDEITIPVAPTVELPTAPTLSAVAFPDSPTLSLPTFTEAAPDTPSSFIQTMNFEWSEDGLATPLLDAIDTKLQGDVANGGYGIDAADETALWARARDREAKQLGAAETSIEERYSGLGFSLPPGGMLSALTRARSEMETNLSEMDREIAIKRAELFRDNRQFAMTHGATVENIQLQHYGFKLERALNAQRFAAEYAINVHDAYVRQFNAELQRYTAIAEVYRTRLQGALAQVQIYEAEVRAAIARQQANQVDVDLYQALLQAATTRVNLFEAQLRGASVTAEIQRLKVDSYRSQVQGFASRIAANEAQLNAYRTEISGEAAKVDIFRAEVGGYTDRVRAAGIEQQIASDRVNTALATRETELRAYQAQIEKYQADVSIERSRIDAILGRYSGDVSLFNAAMNGYDALVRNDLSRDNHELELAREDTRRLQENARLRLAAETATLENQFNSANAGAALATGIIRAAASTFQGIALESTDNT